MYYIYNNHHLYFIRKQNEKIKRAVNLLERLVKRL